MQPFDRRLTRTALVVALLITVAAGLVVTASAFVHLPTPVVVSAAGVWFGGLVAMGVLGFFELLMP